MRRTVLIIDDTPCQLAVAVKLVEDHGYQVAIAQDGEEGVERAALLLPDLILLDVALPGTGGLEICRRLKAQLSTRDIPVIFMMALVTPQSKLKGFEAGGVDYVTKPLQNDEVVARVGTHLMLRAARRQLAAQNLELENHGAVLEQRVAERTLALTDSERRFRTLAENLPDCVVRYDRMCRVTYFNPAVFRNLAPGFQLVLDIALDESHPDVKPARAYRQLLEQVMAKGDGGEMELEVRDPGGERRAHHVRMVVERDANGVIIGGLVIGRDVTKRKQVECALKQSERRYREIFENSSDALYLAEVSHHGRFRNLAFNAAFEKSTGIPRELLINDNADGVEKNGNLVGNVMTADTVRAAIEILRRCLNAGVAIEEEFAFDLPSGRRHYHSSMVPLRDASGRIYRILCIARDVSERKQMAQRLEESQLLLRQLAARNEEAREDERRYLKREIHDELGQYLSALRLGISVVDIQLERKRSPLHENTHRLIEVVDATIKVVRDLVAALRPSALDLGVVSALEWLTAKHFERTRIQCALHIPVYDLDMDDKHATAVFRIVQESLTNIVRHAQATQVTISLEQSDVRYRLEVRDNGQGFDPSVRKEESFGLVGIRERALMLGGEVDIFSAPGQTSIRVQFPVGR